MLAPRISLNEVTEITRNTARISAEIELRREGTVTSCKFLYGTSEDMAEALQQEAEGVEGNVETCLTGLQAGHRIIIAWKYQMVIASCEVILDIFRPCRTPYPFWAIWS